MANASNHAGGALIMLHPHPLYGGSMHNAVVDAVILAAQQFGLATLRFNFRGVGRSHGEFSDGVGEADDVAAALAFLSQASGSSNLILVGYSFGASVALSYCQSPDHGVKHLFLVALPPVLLEDGVSLEIPEIAKIVLGETDALVPLQEIKAVLSERAQKSLLQIIPGADHFFSGKVAELKEVFQGLLSEVIPQIR